MNENTATAEDDLWPLIERFHEGVLLVAANPWKVIRANTAAAQQFKQTAEQLAGSPVDDLFDAASRAAICTLFERELAGDSGNAPLLVKLSSALGHNRLVGLQCCPVVWKGAFALGVWLYNVQRSAEYWWRIDPLTGLKDRTFLEVRLRELLNDAEHPERIFGILFVDLDDFKAVNDRFGHLVADQVLREAAQRLARCIGRDDCVVRYGGDEFVVLIENASNAQDFEAIVEDIRKAIAPPIKLPEGEFQLSTSVGVAISSPKYRTPAEMLAAADLAMYAVKRGRV